MFARAATIRTERRDAVGLWCSKLMAMSSALLSMIILNEHAKQIGAVYWKRGMGIGLFAFQLPLLYWSFVGMEASFIAFLNLMQILAFLSWIQTEQRRDLWWFSVLGVLSTMTRPEAILVYGFSWLWAVLFVRRTRQILESTVIFTILFGAFLLWRYSYYGFWLPNTFYAKVDRFGLALLQKGLVYAALFCIPHILLLFPAIRTIVLRKGGNENLYLALLAFVQIAVVIFEGGDHYPAGRFFVPILPVLALLWIHTDFEIPEAYSAVLVCACCILTFAAGYFLRGYRAFESAAGGERGQFASRWLVEHVPPNTSIATMSVGAVPYYTNLPTLDLVGLVDLHIGHAPVATGHGKIGHEKFDNNYVMQRKPGLFLFAPCYHTEEQLLKEAGGILPMYDDLLRNHFPNPDYTFVSVKQPQACFSLLVRKDVAARWKLDPNGLFVGMKN